MRIYWNELNLFHMNWPFVASIFKNHYHAIRYRSMVISRWVRYFHNWIEFSWVESILLLCTWVCYVVVAHQLFNLLLFVTVGHVFVTVLINRRGWFVNSKSLASVWFHSVVDWSGESEKCLGCLSRFQEAVGIFGSRFGCWNCYWDWQIDFWFLGDRVIWRRKTTLLTLAAEW